MPQFTIKLLRAEAGRLALTPLAGPTDERPIERVDIVSVDRLDQVAAGTLAIIPETQHPAPFRVDVALRQASARGFAGMVFAADIALTETAVAVASRGSVPVFGSAGPGAAELAKTIDRMISGGASEAMMRASHAIEAATEAAAEPAATVGDVLAVAGAALGDDLTFVDDSGVPASATNAVLVGEVPIGRVDAGSPDAATTVALPVIAALVSRTAGRQTRARFAPTQSRADLLLELVLSEATRVEGFVGQAARLGLPLQHAHTVAWLSPSNPADPDGRAPRSLQPALELFALQLVESREELWHVAFLQDDMMIVGTEERGRSDFQRRVRQVAERVQEHARELAETDWIYTLGLGTPQLGALGLRRSAAEARIAAESAIAAGRLGGVELTDVTGLGRVLLDVYASPISRELLHDVLRPLDDLGPERARTAVRTLLSYLTNRGSFVKAGRELTLHPNGVSYRMTRIRELLDIDFDDPDVRFAVELACRVRLLGD